MFRKIISVMAVVAVSLSGCRSAELKSVDNTNKEYFIGKYIRDTEDFLDVYKLMSDGESVYVFGDISSYANPKMLSIYDTENNIFKKIDLADKNIASVDTIYLYSGKLLVGYHDRDMKGMLICIDEESGSIETEVSIPENRMCRSVASANSGDFYVLASDNKNKVPEYDLFTYNVKLENTGIFPLKDKLALENGEIPLKVISDEKDGFYILTYNVMKSFRQKIYKVSEDFDIIFSYDDFSDIGGSFSCFSIGSDGEPIIFSESDFLLCADELDRETGKVTERFNIDIETENSEKQFLNNIIISNGMSSGKYDIIYEQNGKFYGYDIHSEKCEELFVPDEYIVSGSITSSYCFGDLIVFSSDLYRSGTSLLCWYKYDGSRINSEVVETHKGNILSSLMCDGTAYFLSSEENETDIDFIIESEGKIVSEFLRELNGMQFLYVSGFEKDKNDAFHLSYILSSDENIVLSTIVIDKTGNILYNNEREVSDISAKHIIGENTDYILYDDAEKGRVICSIDIVSGKEKIINIKDTENDSIEEIFSGSDEYDFYYTSENIIYGFSEKGKKPVQIIDWNGLDICAYPELLFIQDKDNIVCLTYEEDLSNTICVVSRADEETVQKLKNRTEITAAVFDIPEKIRNSINQFNNSDLECLIRIKDYHDDTETFKKDILSDDAPDIVLWNTETDIEQYIKKGMFADLNKMFDADDSISSDDISDNIISLCSRRGKLDSIMLSCNAYGMVYDRSEWKDISLLDIETLIDFSDSHPESKIFYSNTSDELMEMLISNNISEFFDPENKKVSFDTPKFVRILEFIKCQSAVSEKRNENRSEKNRRFAEDMCFLEKCNISIKNFSYMQKNIIDGDAGIFGVPSECGMNISVRSDDIIGICSSSANKDKAWRFIRFLLSDEYQSKISDADEGRFPVLKSSLDSLKRKCYENYDQAAVDTVFDALGSNAVSAAYSDIIKIINEQTAGFFEGKETAEETADNIQKKVNLYMREAY